MRISALVLLVGIAAPVSKAQWPLINELQSGGDFGGRLELFGPGDGPLDLVGMRLVLEGKTHLFEGPLLMPGKGHLTLRFDGMPGLGPDHMSFTLPEAGGTILLIAADGSTILDVFTWGALPEGWSKGRVSDGSLQMACFDQPSFDSPNKAVSTTGKPFPLPRMLADGCRSVALVADPADLWSAETGIDVEGAHANFSRTGAEWERPAFVQTGDTTGHWACLRISGSGTRGLPKRSFTADGEQEGIVIPGLGTWPSITFRADGSPHAFLRACFMEQVVRSTGARVDVQPSHPIELFLNGRDRGLYRAMPAKNAAWVRSIRGDEAVDLLSGPGLEVVSGSSAHFEQCLDLLLNVGALHELEHGLDLESLIDLACFDLYTGRADHDLNVRCWRPRRPDGRWRWILYDMDLWSLAEENSLERMLRADPDDAPYLPALFGHQALRARLLERLIVLLNTTLSPARATAAIDSIHLLHRDRLLQNHERWAGEMNVAEPEESRAWHLHFASVRPALLLGHLAKASGLSPCDVEVSVEPPGAGTVSLGDLVLTDDHTTVHALAGVPLRSNARPAEGMEFVRWAGAEGKEGTITVDPAEVRRLRAVFRPAALSGRHRLQQAGE